MKEIFNLNLSKSTVILFSKCISQGIKTTLRLKKNKQNKTHMLYFFKWLSRVLVSFELWRTFIKNESFRRTVFIPPTQLQRLNAKVHQSCSSASRMSYEQNLFVQNANCAHSGSKDFIPSGPSSFFSAISKAAHALSSVNSSGAWNTKSTVNSIYNTECLVGPKKWFKLQDLEIINKFLQQILNKFLSFLFISSHYAQTAMLTEIVDGFSSIHPTIKLFHNPSISSIIH